MFTFTLPVGYAYCTAAPCLTPRAISNLTETRSGEFTVASGSCNYCGGMLARVYVTGQGVPLTVAKLDEMVGDESTTQAVQIVGFRPFGEVMRAGHDTYQYNADGWGGRNTWVPTRVDDDKLSGRMFGWEVLTAFSDSVDVCGSRYDGRARWEDILRVKAGAGHFDAVLEALAREGMDMPAVAYNRDGKGRGGWTIGNGHHRLVASLLLGMVTIPVMVSDRDYMCMDDSMDDEGRPLDAQGRVAWGMLRNVLPAALGEGWVPSPRGARTDDEVASVHPAAVECMRCRVGCTCCQHAYGCKVGIAEAEAKAAADLAKRADPKGTHAERRAAVAAGVEAAKEAVQVMARDARAWAERCDAEAVKLEAEIARLRNEAMMARARVEAYNAIVIG